MEEQKTTTSWLNKEVEELDKQKKFIGEKLPALQFEENKIVTFTIDFTNQFEIYEDTANKCVKAIIPVTHNGEKKILWLNKKNPLYIEIVHLGSSGQTEFKVMQIGNKANTKYNLVKE